MSVDGSVDRGGSRATTKQVVLALKVVLWLGALSPAVWLGAAFYFDWFGVPSPFERLTLGVNPIEELTHVTGMTTLVLLLVTLAVTPVRRISGWNPLIRIRRPLGLFAFFYALVHFSIWMVLDLGFRLDWVWEDIVERPYITVGFAAFLILIPLALTSTKGWIRCLGRRWGRLHKGVYVAAGLGVVHYYWLVKADVRLPLALGAVLVVLLAARLLHWWKGRGRPARGRSRGVGRASAGAS